MISSATTTGKVYLIGAGPGDPDLLTLKAVKILQRAEIVLTDDLVNDAILEHLPSQARRIEVGKRGGCRSTPQAFIHQLMIHYARQGHDVIRLKGGDPFMFGRGGEEIQVLQAAGIDTEVINGITAGMAAPTTLGIPVTHRDFCPGVSFITGHRAHQEDVLNWRALVDSGLTLVIYMGMKNLGEICRQLQNAGMSSTMPIAVIQNGTLAPIQQHIISTLEHVEVDAKNAKLGSPSIIIIGQVIQFAVTQVTSSPNMMMQVA